MTEANVELRRKGLIQRAFGAVLVALGLFLAGGGAYLISLGGSWYYLIAGVAMIGTGYLLYVGSSSALWVYAALTLGTLIWAVVEIGVDWWQLVPRGDIVVILGLLLLLPFVTRALRDPAGRPASAFRGAGLALTASLGLAAAVGVVALLSDFHTEDGSLPGSRGAASAGLMAAPDDWPAYARTWAGNKYSPLAQLTPANVGDLEEAWRVRTGDLKRKGDPFEVTNQVTPIKIGDTVYICTPHNIVLALDAETGAQRWRYDPKIAVAKNLQHLTCRGVSYHDARVAGAARAADGGCPQRILMATNDARLIALDAATGRLCPGFGSAGQVNLWTGMPKYQPGLYQVTSAPLVTRGLVIVGGAVYDDFSTEVPSGVIRAFDVATGQLVWNFDPGNPGSTAPLQPGQRYSMSSPNMWTTAAADEALGLLYLPMGMGAIDQWGGNRPATTEQFATAVVALDIATGRLRWVYQTVHHDVWDMDIPAQPALVDLDLPGRGRVPALVQSTKTGNLFVLDRRTGTPVHAAPERPVPQGAAPGDRLSPTQPFSTVTFMPQRRIREADMWGGSMFDQMLCRIKFRSLRYDGPFTPPSLQGSLLFPGNLGVMDWGGVAIDPVRQVVFANPDYLAFTVQLIDQRRIKGDYGSTTGQAGPSGGSDLQASKIHGLNPNTGAPYAVAMNPFLSPLGLPCQAPPWGYVAGLDLVSGKVVYKRPNGTIRDVSPIPVPIKMGVPSLGPPLLTGGGVAFMGSAIDDYMRAYDVTTGKQLWQHRLPAGGQAGPMTYRSAASGRQFVVVMAGGHGSLGTRMGDYLIAYALPKRTAASGAAQ